MSLLKVLILCHTVYNVYSTHIGLYMIFYALIIFFQIQQQAINARAINLSSYAYTYAYT